MNKEIYFYWGNQSMSFLRFMTLKSFSIFNPEWRINLIINDTPASNTWQTGEEQDNKNYKGYDYRTKIHEIHNIKIIDLKTIFPRNTDGMSNIHIKDMLNWFLLSTRSCAVADMDIIFCKPINSGNAIDWNAHVNICCYDFYKNYIPVSFMLSNLTDDRRNIFYDQVYKNSILKYNPIIYESCGFKCIEFKSIYEIIDKYKDIKINKMDHMVVFPFVYPDPSAVSDKAFNGDNSSWFTENTIGVHWYGGQDISQKNNNLVTLENFKNFDNTVVNIIKILENKI